MPRVTNHNDGAGASQNAPALTVENLSKSYGRNRALIDVDLDVPAGDVFGVLGPNGAGKTTLFRLVLGLIGADSGRVVINGDPIARRHKASNVTGTIENGAFLPHLTGEQNIDVLLRLSGLDRRQRRHRVQDALDQVGLSKVRTNPVRAFSQGQRQRLALAAGLAVRPDLLLLDEPTNGLDPVGISNLLDLVSRLPSRGTTVVLASHQLHDVERVCNSVAILVEGRVRLVDTVANLSTNNSVLWIRTVDDVAAANMLERELGLSPILDSGSGLNVPLDSTTTDDVLRCLTQREVGIVAIETTHETLANAYSQITEGATGD